MIKRFLLFLLTISMLTGIVSAENKTVAVMDLGTHPGAVPIDINILNAGRVASDYSIEFLIDDGSFDVMDKALIEDILDEDNIKYEGIIDPDTARTIGQMLGAKYLIYGNVNDVTLSDVGAKSIVGGVTVCTVKSHVILRMMDVSTGDIVSMGKGEGASKSSRIKAGVPVLTIDVGTRTVTQDSVHNAIREAAYNAAASLIKRVKV